MLCTGIALSATLLNTVYASPNKTPELTNPNITIIDNKVSLNANNIPLEELLALISQSARFKLTLKGDFPEPLSATFKALPLDKAIINLAGENAVIITYTAHGPKQLQKVDEVIVYSNHLKNSPNDNDLAELDSISKLNIADALINLTEDETITFLTQKLSAVNTPISKHISATELLGEIGSPNAIRSLTLGLSNPNKQVRSKTIEVLGQLDDLHASLALAQVTLGDTDSEQRILALRALAKHEASNTLIFIRQVMLRDVNKLVRHEASTILKQLLQTP